MYGFSQLKRLIPALRPRNIPLIDKQQSIDAILTNVQRESQWHPRGNIYETLIPTLTQQVMTNLLAFDLIDVQPGWCKTESLLSSRLLYDEHNDRALERIAAEMVDEINAKLLHFLYDLAEDVVADDLLVQLRNYPGCWCVANPCAYRLIAAAPDFRVSARPGFGRLAGLDVYQAWGLAETAPVLIGHRGSGVVYTPYLPIRVACSVTETVLTFCSQAVTLLPGSVDYSKIYM
jgi:hypothetical protein